MRRLSGTTLSIRLFLGLDFAQDSSSVPRLIRGDAFTKGTHGEPAVLPDALIVICRPITKETELCAKGAFAIDRLTPGTYRIEVNAPGLYASVCTDAPSTGPVEMNMTAVSSTTRLAQLKAMDCAFGRKAHHA